MKVLLINGSPNEHGCTYTALSETAETLQKHGIDTEILYLAKAGGGLHCLRQMQRDRKCVFDDKVNEVIDKLDSIDAIVVGSPVYYASANGSLYSFLDRLFYAGSCFAFKPAAAVASARRAGTTLRSIP